MKILITGCYGYIGSNLTYYLLEQGFEVIGVDIINRNLFKHPKFAFLEHDLKDELNIECEEIYHFAAKKDLRNSDASYYIYNLRLTFNILELALKNDAKLIFSSTASVGQNNAYSKSKKMEEDIIKEFCEENFLRYSILRIPNPYGYLHPSLKIDRGSNNLEEIILRGKPFELFTEDGVFQKRPFLKIEDLIEKLLNLELGLNVMNVLDMTTKEFLDIISKRENKKFKYKIKELKWI